MTNYLSPGVLRTRIAERTELHSSGSRGDFRTLTDDLHYEFCVQDTIACEAASMEPLNLERSQKSERLKYVSSP